MTISGGTIDAYSSAGDGFDSNGDLTITGDTVIVWTANTADNEPLDADGTITVSGGTVLAAGGSSGMGMGGGFPGGGQKPDGEPPESFDGQMPNGEKSELPDGEVPEMPSGERPHRPVGREAPLTATPQRATVPPIPLQLPNGRDKKSRRLAQTVCFLLSVRFYIVSKPTITPPRSA